MLTIAHATALCPEDEPIFEHALALACAGRARLYSVNAQGGAGDRLPDAARVLARWGKSPASIDHQTLFHSCCDDPVDTVLDALRSIAPNLVVLGTHQRRGLAHLVGGSHAEAVLRNLREPTLVFPVGARGFVSAGGAITIRRIVIPAGDEAAVAAAQACAGWFAELAGVTDFQIARVSAPEARGIADAVLEAGGDLIVMATRGVDSLGDVLFGTHTEHVLRRACCPILVVPM